VADQPSGPAAAEQRELAALRRRAYGPDADIFADPDALARLTTLEDRMRRARTPSPDADPAERARQEAVAPAPVPAAGEPVTVVLTAEPAAARAPRWHARLVTGTAVVAIVLGATAWTASQTAPAASPPSGDAKAAATATERRAAGYEEGYDRYLDGLREEVLTLPGGGDVAERMIRDQLRPYGILYGRTVGAGPTVDNRFCMIVADLPAASVTCISIENAYANPVSVVLPSWYSDAESDMFTGLGEPISYTLMPGGSVVAVPADSAASMPADSLPVRPATAPTPTATPPPGWQ
jgi:hypothetical protein